MRYDWSCSSCSLSLYNVSGKGVRQEKETWKRDRNDTRARAQSLPVKYSVVKIDIGNFVGVPLTDADRRKVLFNRRKVLL